MDGGMRCEIWAAGVLGRERRAAASRPLKNGAGLVLGGRVRYNRAGMDARAVRDELAEALRCVARGELSGQALADWACERWWALMEGEAKDDESPEAALLRDVLGGISGQWELLIGNAYMDGGREAVRAVRIPGELLAAWAGRLGRSGREALPARGPGAVSWERAGGGAMRGQRDPQVSMLAFVDLEERVPRDHPLRTIKALADRALAELSTIFDAMYAEVGRPSIPPERLLKASLLIALYSVRSERAFCEELEYNLLFRWFLDMDLIEPSFDATTFSKNRERLLHHRVGQELFDEVVADAHERGLLSEEHFTVDGTLIEAAASLKSFKRKDGEPPRATDDDPGNPSVDFRGEKRSNATHRSTTDPEARLFKKGKGKEAKLVFMAHALMENRNGMLVDFQLTEAGGTAERDAVPRLLDQARERHFRPKTLGADKGYDTRDCVAEMRARKVTPHVARNTSGRRSAIDGRTTRHPGYAASQRVRKRVEEIFGWMKTVGGFRRTRHRGLDKTGLAGYLVATAYNLVRLSGLAARRSETAAAA